MKTKIVLWGQRGEAEAKEKVLLALELQPGANQIQTWLFKESDASEEFYEELWTKWRKGEAVSFPESHETFTQALSAAEDILPLGLEVFKDTDLKFLESTKNEWLVIVLSDKLVKQYEGEVDGIEERMSRAQTYDKALWEELKAFQAKLQKQIDSKNIQGYQTNRLRSRLNDLFDQLKKLREAEEDAFEKASQALYDKFVTNLGFVNQAIEAPRPDYFNLFEQLKKMQNDFRSAKLTRQMRNELWDKIDEAFKNLKAKRNPNNGGASNAANADPNSSAERNKSRMEGLVAAIQKMEESVQRDQRDLDQMNQRSGSGSQLEAQLREVRSKLIRERLESKQEKLADMRKTLQDLEDKQKRLETKVAKESAKAAKSEEKANAPEENSPIEPPISANEVEAEPNKDSDDTPA